jgi:adenylate kinase family enzyme
MLAVHVSSSALLKSAIEKKTNLGMQALAAFTKDQYVPDRVMIDLVMLRLSQPDAQEKGWILEGFPRTRDQALALQKKGMLPSHVFVLDWPDTTLLELIAQVVVDPVTNIEYCLAYPEEIPAEAKSRLTHKAKYSEAAVKEKLHMYRRHLAGILSCFKSYIRIPITGTQILKPPASKPAVASNTLSLSPTTLPVPPSGPRGPSGRPNRPRSGIPMGDNSGPPTTFSIEGQLDAIEEVLKVRKPTSGTAFHRLFLCGGTASMRHEICQLLESQFQLIYCMSSNSLVTFST